MGPRLAVDEPGREPDGAFGEVGALADLGGREQALAQMHVAVRAAVWLEHPPIAVVGLGRRGAVLLGPEVLVDDREGVVEDRGRAGVTGGQRARGRQQHVRMTVRGLGRVAGAVAPDGLEIAAGDRVAVLPRQRAEAQVDDPAAAGDSEHLAEGI